MMKIWSSKQRAVDSIENLDLHKGVTTLKLCTGEYKTSIKEIENKTGADAIYKSYRSDRHGSYVILYGLYRNK